MGFTPLESLETAYEKSSSDNIKYLLSPYTALMYLL